VYIIDGARTPFLKAGHGPGPFTPVDLAVQCGRPLLLRQRFGRDAFDRVILGCVNVIADEMNPARVAALRLGMGEAMPAFTVQINCASGMQSIESACHAIRTGTDDLILAGGTEALSHAPLVYRREAVEWFADLAAAKGPIDGAIAAAGIRPALLKPVIGLERGLTDPITKLNMGQTAEIVGHLFHVQRADADQYAVTSHLRLAEAQRRGWLNDEIEPAISRDGELFEHDTGVRPDTSVEALGRLEPVFEKPWGNVTAGNSSQITDGACWVILASESALKNHGLEPKAKIVDSAWSALHPSVMGLAPVLCVSELLSRAAMGIHDIDLCELNEAFAAQVLACLTAFADDTFCRRVLSREHALGHIDRARLNVDGGAISLGHPVGTSGNRIVLHLVNALRRTGAKRGIATECIGGGQGGAMLIEAA
jgi:acetyl-CoA C-acetyltransferase